eukprot:TRINITY_DN9347_c0_g1_i3.p1 TRINITY_DN9347_c0_g1~~TRINITY_DN9347_c0_g1_i3.p1  ORF type:complete len:1184 (+),score=271.19 TRINITY_DN9347_c0_g1_i3:66-3617(+)
MADLDRSVLNTTVNASVMQMTPSKGQLTDKENVVVDSIMQPFQSKSSVQPRVARDIKRLGDCAFSLGALDEITNLGTVQTETLKGNKRRKSESRRVSFAADPDARPEDFLTKVPESPASTKLAPSSSMAKFRIFEDEGFDTLKKKEMPVFQSSKHAQNSSTPVKEISGNQDASDMELTEVVAPPKEYTVFESSKSQKQETDILAAASPIAAPKSIPGRKTKPITKYGRLSVMPTNEDELTTEMTGTFFNIMNSIKKFVGGSGFGSLDNITSEFNLGSDQPLRESTEIIEFKRNRSLKGLESNPFGVGAKRKDFEDLFAGVEENPTSHFEKKENPIERVTSTGYAGQDSESEMNSMNADGSDMEMTSCLQNQAPSSHAPTKSANDEPQNSIEESSMDLTRCHTSFNPAQGQITQMEQMKQFDEDMDFTKIHEQEGSQQSRSINESDNQVSFSEITQQSITMEMTAIHAPSTLNMHDAGNKKTLEHPPMPENFDDSIDARSASMDMTVCHVKSQNTGLIHAAMLSADEQSTNVEIDGTIADSVDMEEATVYLFTNKKQSSRNDMSMTRSRRSIGINSTNRSILANQSVDMEEATVYIIKNVDASEQGFTESENGDNSLRSVDMEETAVHQFSSIPKSVDHHNADNESQGDGISDLNRTENQSADMEQTQVHSVPQRQMQDLESDRHNEEKHSELEHSISHTENHSIASNSVQNVADAPSMEKINQPLDQTIPISFAEFRELAGIRFLDELAFTRRSNSVGVFMREPDQLTKLEIVEQRHVWSGLLKIAEETEIDYEEEIASMRQMNDQLETNLGLVNPKLFGKVANKGYLADIQTDMKDLKQVCRLEAGLMTTQKRTNYEQKCHNFIRNQLRSLVDGLESMQTYKDKMMELTRIVQQEAQIFRAKSQAELDLFAGTADSLETARNENIELRRDADSLKSQINSLREQYVHLQEQHTQITKNEIQALEAAARIVHVSNQGLSAMQDKLDTICAAVPWEIMFVSKGRIQFKFLHNIVLELQFDADANISELKLDASKCIDFHKNIMYHHLGGESVTNEVLQMYGGKSLASIAPIIHELSYSVFSSNDLFNKLSKIERKHHIEFTCSDTTPMLDIRAHLYSLPRGRKIIIGFHLPLYANELQPKCTVMEIFGKSPLESIQGSIDRLLTHDVSSINEVCDHISAILGQV